MKYRCVLTGVPLDRPKQSFPPTEAEAAVWASAIFSKLTEAQRKYARVQVYRLGEELVSTLLPEEPK